ncbi:MAG: 2-oxo acid dehydrogenase subunit E2, partial [Actinobacteria bacterium]|nr:2-oxo acid dehydrogenase subunit E2 [Actinomycetota bacterium]
TEAVLASWPLAENVPYSAADVIATVETAKAVVDIEAEEDGVILRRLVAEGASVAAGQPIALIGVPGESAEGIEDLLREHELADGAPPSAVTGSGPTSAAGQQRQAERIFTSPLARRLAREGDLDLRMISGTGPNGRIMRRDVEQALRAARTAPAATMPAAAARIVPPAADHTVVPHGRVRQAIASRMTESKQTVPHFYVSGSARAGRLVQLRAELNDGTNATRVSVNDLVIKAVARAHQLVPAMNVIWTPDALLCYEGVDIGVAIASPRGLVTPVLRSVEQASISALAAAVADLTDRAAAGRLQQRELEGGTTCVSNLGMFGVEQFSAIINPPQSSILAVGAVHDAPLVEQGELRAGSVLRVTLSADHRAVDGTTAAEWMRAFVGLIERPVQILA